MDTQKTALLFGIHCHQPVDNFHHIVKEAILKSYQPFFKTAALYEEFRFSVHISGWLLEMIQKLSPELFCLMQELSQREQIEFFTGGYYEPVLASIPSKDRIDQIQKLNDFLWDHFGQKPKGVWLSERVWDGSIVADLVRCGIEYVVVDDTHFLGSGFDEDALNGFFLTEESGFTIKIFPVSKKLRYLIPFREVEAAMEHLESLFDPTLAKAAVIFDDGEKFGIWPKTHEWVYKKGWLDRFMRLVVSSKSVRAERFGDFARQNKPLGLVYLPTTSYYEMNHWSLKVQDATALEELLRHCRESKVPEHLLRFVKGGIWKNFFVKYRESNHMHKRVLELSKVRGQIDDPEFDDNLFRAQTNDVFWHGIFGGLYLPNLRDNFYRYLINCENIRYKSSSQFNIIAWDINLDGYEEIKAVSEKLIAIFESKNGGQLAELSLRDVCFNLQNTLARYKEAYHRKAQESAFNGADYEGGITTIHEQQMDLGRDLGDLLVYDWHAKNSFVDHITDTGWDLESFERCTYGEFGDFANQPFLWRLDGNSIHFSRNGGIYVQKERFPTLLSKKYTLQKDSIEFEIKIESRYPQRVAYLLEFNLHFADINSIYLDGRPFWGKGELQGIQRLAIKDPYTNKKIEWSFDMPSDCRFYPVNTVSQSESGFVVTNQGLCLGFSFAFEGELSLCGNFFIGE